MITWRLRKAPKSHPRELGELILSLSFDMAPRGNAKAQVESKQKLNPRKLKQKREREELQSLQARVDAFDLSDVQDFGELPLSKATQEGLK